MAKRKTEFNYFDKFIESINFAHEAAIKLKIYLCNFDIKNAQNEMKEMHEIENNADKNLHELKNYLLKDFLPPIDREDILTIAHKIDDIVDGIDEIIIDIDILNVKEITENVKILIVLLETTTQKVCELLKEFKNIKKTKEIQEYVVEVNKLEEQADRLYENAIKELYTSENNPIQIIKWTNIYQTIENCFDACENVADSIEEVLMKNS